MAIDPPDSSSQIQVIHDNNDWHQFRLFNQRVHQLYLDLSVIDDEFKLYESLVHAGVEQLEIDRIGILLIDHENNDMLGTFGVDERGVIIEHKNFRKAIPEAPWVEESLKAKDYVFVNEDVELEENHKVLGKGWNSMAAFWDKDKAIGWIACDNLLKQTPLPLWKREILGELARVTGQLVLRLRSETKLKHINENLNELVNIRTGELIELQERLIQSEKQASLSQLTAGIAHELNTPIGNALTMATTLSHRSNQLKQQLDNESIKRAEFDEYVVSAKNSSDLIYRSLTKAAELIFSFKQIAVDRSFEKIEPFNLLDIVQDVCTAIKRPLEENKIEVNSQSNRELAKLISYQSAYIQIFTQLFSNVITHAFIDDPEQKYNHKVDIDISKDENDQLIIHFADNGKGIEPDLLKRIYDPFVTSKRGAGSKGLGLHIVFNVVTQTLGGTIDISSEQGRSTTFKLSVPNQLPISK